jgi:hypothetical protein
MCYNKDVNDIEKIYFSIMVKQKRDYEVKKERVALFLFKKITSYAHI